MPSMWVIVQYQVGCSRWDPKIQIIVLSISSFGQTPHCPDSHFGAGVTKPGVPAPQILILAHLVGQVSAKLTHLSHGWLLWCFKLQEFKYICCWQSG